MSIEDFNDGVQVVTTDSETLSLINKAEMDIQIVTAKKYPRSIKSFLNESLELATLNEKVAEECNYALPRKENGKTKMIEGPSARFAEIVASSWGNCRAGARVVAEDKEFITAQGIFHDLEKNVAITYEVKRRITGKDGRRFSTDMIAVTGNAACSIALRNAVLKGIPKAFWVGPYEAARKTAMGDAKTLVSRRSDALGYFKKLGVTEEQICATLGVKGVEDIGLEGLATLSGLKTAIKDGDTTVERAFSPDTGESRKENIVKRFTEEAPEGVDPATGEVKEPCEFCHQTEGHSPTCPNAEPPADLFDEKKKK